MDKRPDYKTFKKKALENQKVREVYEAFRPDFEFMMEFIQARKKSKALSKEKIAKKNSKSKNSNSCIVASPMPQ